MPHVARFTVSLDPELLGAFDRHIAAGGQPNRSQAVAELIRHSLVEEQWQGGAQVAAALVLVYDHHRRGVSARLTEIQHGHHDLIISSQHIHLDHDRCLEIVAVRGAAEGIRALATALRGIRGLDTLRVVAASSAGGS